MKNILKIIAAGLMVITFTSAKADIQIGLGLMLGQVDTSGTETEGAAADTSNRTKSIEEQFAGADLFIETVADDGTTFGISYIPFDIELGSGSRTDVNTAADIAAEADTGTRKAEAQLVNFITLYTNIPMGSNGWYALLGGHMATVETAETLPNATYGNVDVYGAQIGLGMRSGNLKYEASFSDFSDISVASGNNSVSADADSMQFRISYGF
tara:strand:+ start:676 stop:1311 length:636 start_codon:yes stop_codon:yes gene_type:complete